MFKKILVLFLTLMVYSMSNAHTTDSLFYFIDEVRVNGSRVETPLGKSPKMVTILDSVAINSLPVNTVNDLLKYVAGVDLRQRGVYGMQTDVSLRGGTNDQIAVLLNGINLSDPQTGHNAFALPINLNDIERIEILMGPASRVYGVSSLMGAINIVTKTLTPLPINIRIEAGSYGYLNGGVTLSKQFGRFKNLISFNTSRFDGYSKSSSGGLNADFKDIKAYYQVVADTKWAQVQAQIGGLIKGFGANTFYSAKYDNQYEEVAKYNASLQLKTHGKLSFRPTFYWNHTLDRFELVRSNPCFVPFNQHRTNVVGTNLNFVYNSVFGTTVVGVEARHADLISTNLGEALSAPKEYYKGKDKITYKKGINRTNIGFFAEQNINYNSLSASIGLVYIKNTGNTEGFKLYPGIDISYKVLDNLKLFASWNNSFRMPTFTDLYYTAKEHISNKNLKAEKLNSIELGVNYNLAFAKLRASVYKNIGTDMIDWVKEDVNDANWKSVNHTKIISYGEEVVLEIKPQILCGVDYCKNITISYAGVKQDKHLPNGWLSKYALEYLRHKVFAQAVFGVNNFSCALSYIYNHRVGNYAEFDKTQATGKTVAYKPYSLLDIKVNQQFNKWGIYLELNNILNKKYYDYGNIPQPGIMYRAGLTWQL